MAYVSAENGVIYLRFKKKRENVCDWIHAKDLRVNDNVMLIDKSFNKIDNNSSYHHSGTVYNIRVENDHNYYVSEDGILVHNIKHAISMEL